MRYSCVSILVAQGTTWNEIAAFVGHLDVRTTQRYIHFMLKDKRDGRRRIRSRSRSDPQRPHGTNWQAKAKEPQ